MKCDRCNNTILRLERYIERSGANLCELCFIDIALDSLGGKWKQNRQVIPTVEQ